MAYAFAAGLLSWALIWAQSVGIGTALPDPSARLHIEDSERGLLIPRLPLSARNVAAPVTNPATGLLVFNTATAGAGSNRVWPGFYYWNGSEWVRLLIYPNEAWQIEGNFGTDPAIHFLGTIDNQPLRIRVNNQQTLQFNINFSIQRDAGGNPRGTGAVDLQINRDAPTEVASGAYSAVLGGEGNEASGDWAVVAGGSGNNATGANSAICGGGINRAEGAASFIGGGTLNRARGIGCTIGGGIFNEVDGTFTTLCGGHNNSADGDCSCIIAGGHGNVIREGTGHAFIGGGGGNEILPDAADCAILSGAQNRLKGYGSLVLGGYKNEVDGDYTIVGGRHNQVTGDYVLVFGANIDPSTNESHRVYLFGDNSAVPNPDLGEPPVRYSGFLVINRRDGDHPIHVGTNATNGNGAYLSAGGTWTDVSTKESKEGFIELDSVEVLRKVQNLWVGGWRYKGSEEYHVGPVAEDFHALFGTGGMDPRGLSVKDQAGVLFLAVKALAAENAALKAQKERLEERIAVLEERLSRLEGRFPTTLSSK